MISRSVTSGAASQQYCSQVERCPSHLPFGTTVVGHFVQKYNKPLGSLVDVTTFSRYHADMRYEWDERKRRANVKNIA